MAPRAAGELSHERRHAWQKQCMQLGNRLRAKGDLIAAAEFSREAMRADPDSPLPSAALGDTLRHLG